MEIRKGTSHGSVVVKKEGEGRDGALPTDGGNKTALNGHQNWKGEQMFDRGYALLIGIDQNRIANLALPTVKKDITKLKEVLIHPERCGYLEDNVRVLSGPDAKRSNILDGLDWLKEKLAAGTDPNQTAFVYYSGHAHLDSWGESFLIPYDARFPITTGSLRAKDFAEILNTIQPRRLLVVLDCCHAQSMNVKEASPTGVASTAVTVETPGVGLLTEGDGRAVLSSSRDSQQSWARSDGKMSVFTYHLIEALLGHGVRPDWPEVTVTELMEYVGRAVPQTARIQHNAEQVPFFRLSGTAFPIALVLGGKGVAKGIKAPHPLDELPLRVSSKLDVETVEGEATNVDIDEVSGGQVDATTTAKHVSGGGKLTGVKIGTLGSTRSHSLTKSTAPVYDACHRGLMDEYREDLSGRKPAVRHKPKTEFSTTTAHVHVDRADGGQVIGAQVNRRDGDTIKGNQVNAASGGQASNNTGFSGPVKINGPVTIIQGPTWGQPHENTESRLDSLTIEEKIRLDVALPQSAVVDEPFEVVIAVRQPDAPVLTVADLDRVVSGEGSVFRSEEKDVVKYRVELTGAGFKVTPKRYVIELRPRTNSWPVAFQVVSSKKGRRSLIVNAYQENKALVAQTRVTIEVTIAVSTA